MEGANDIIAKEANLVFHHIPGNSRCVICFFHWANTTHSLLFSHFVKQVWKNSKWWTVLKGLKQTHMIDIIHSISRCASHKDLEQFCVKLWGIWKDRCNWTHKPQHPGPHIFPLDMGYWTDNFLFEYHTTQKRINSNGLS